MFFAIAHVKHFCIQPSLAIRGVWHYQSKAPRFVPWLAQDLGHENKIERLYESPFYHAEYGGCGGRNPPHRGEPRSFRRRALPREPAALTIPTTQFSILVLL